MNRISPLLGLIAVISLLLFAISPAPAEAAPPVFEPLGQLKSGMRIPAALDVDAAGNLYAADARGGKVYKINPYGAIVQTYDVQASGRGVAVTPEGATLYVAQADEVVIVDTATGAVTGALDGAEPTGSEFGLAGEIDLDPSGNVFVADVGNQKMAIKIYDANGVYLNQFGGPGTLDGQFRRIGGMAISPQGKVVVADSSYLNGKIQTFTMNPNLTAVPPYTAVLSHLKTSTIFGAPQLYNPRGIAYDNQGRAYFIEFQQANLRIMSPAFTFLSKFVDTSVDTKPMIAPIDVAFDPSTSRLFVSSDGVGIKIFGIDGGANPVYVNTPPSVPVPVSPVGNAEVGSATPTLIIGNSVDEQGDALTYHVVVKQGDTVVYDDPAIPATPGDTTHVQIEGVTLAEDTAFSWTVQASDGQEMSPVSSVAQFVVNANQPPAMPMPQSPVGGSEMASASPTLMINNPVDPNGDALTYLVAIQRDGVEIHQAEVAGSDGAVTTVTLSDLILEENAYYSWTAQAFDGMEHSETCPPATFVVNAMDEPPSAPELIAPGEGEVLDGFAALSWGTSVDPDPNDLELSYQVEIAADSTFASIVAAEALTANALSLDSFANYLDLQDGTTYFWRVKALDQDQTVSNPSAVQSFVYDTTQLFVTANLPDVSVYLSGNSAYEGQPVGSSPVAMRDLATGVVNLVVTKPGFEPYQTQLVIGERENVSHHAILVPAMDPFELSFKKNAVNGKRGLSVSGNAVPFMVDYNNDGQIDLLVADDSGQLHLYTEVTWVKRNTIDIAGEVVLADPILPGTSVPFVADWDNDGRKDLLVGLEDGSIKFYQNLGLNEAPAFGAAQDVQAGAAVLNVGVSAAPAVIDFNHDQRKDLLVGNGSGDILLYVNQGSDEQPLLSEPVVLFTVGGAAIPMPLDWDEDGVKEILVTAAGTSAVYAETPDGFVLSRVLCTADPTLVARPEEVLAQGAFATFAIDLTGGGGKELLVGAPDGSIHYMNGESSQPVASYQIGLLEKIDELAGLVADEAPALLADVDTIRAYVEVSDFALAKQETDLLITKLTAGPAQGSAQELTDLYVNTQIVVL
ncbi:MAG: VCBS repeat-containing protein [Deltaproteobacteria bacterium]|jgi:hypothetical protein|nr:VCBS repeat-containing protein [Deltaproteobacteria bacterium]